MNKEFPDDDDDHEKDDDDDHKKDDDVDDHDHEKDDDDAGPGVSERRVPRALQRGSSLGRGVRTPVVWRRLCLAGGWNHPQYRLCSSPNYPQ